MNTRTLKVLEFDKIISRLEDFASFSLGKEKIRCLSPLENYVDIARAMKETSDAESCILKRGNPPMGGATDIKLALLRLDIGGVLGASELLKVGGVLRASRNLRKYFSDAVKGGGAREDFEAGVKMEDAVAGYIWALQPNRTLEEQISIAIISDEEISDAASHELRSIRRKIREAQESIKSKMNEIIRSPKYQKILQDAIITVKSGRYVVPVKAEHRSSVPGLIHDSSGSGATIFIEPIAVVEANNKIKQLQIDEELEIEKILAELSSACGDFYAELYQNLELLSQLDFVFAKAKLSLDMMGVSPKLNNNGFVNIMKGRHPLIDKNRVVPIDFWIGKDFKSVIVTGPNTGGKTVTLKTVGLFTLMVQAGLNIPAAFGTEMSVFTDVFADIGDEQSIEQSLSTFSSHMSNIVRIIENSSYKTLVLLDELGAGTDPTEGAALAMSILENLRSSGATIVATTHYSELKVYALSTDGVENASCEFDVETLRPTYRLLIGIPGKSNAFAISTRLGLKSSVVERAKEFLTTEAVKFEDMIMTLEKNKIEAERERLLAEKYRLEAEQFKSLIENKHIDLQKKKDEILRKSREEAQALLENATKQAAEVLEAMKLMSRKVEISLEDSIKNSMQDSNQNSGNAKWLNSADELRISLKRSLDDIENKMSFKAKKNNDDDEAPKELVVGEFVKIINLGQEGTVLTLPKNDGMVQVQIGNKKINIHSSNLRRTKRKGQGQGQSQGQGQGKPAPSQRANANRISAEKTSGAVTEIKVIGMNVDEGTMMIDKFLDDCALANLTEVRIVHGKGTGALRAGVHQFLKHHKHVKEFRIGTFGEGDNGVTIVTLK